VECDATRLKTDSRVESVSAWTRPYRLASRDAAGAQPTTPVRIGSAPDAVIGGHGVVVIAGPCSVEGLEMLRATAVGVRKRGGIALSGRAPQPRTSSHGLQRLGE